MMRHLFGFLMLNDTIYQLLKLLNPVLRNLPFRVVAEPHLGLFFDRDLMPCALEQLQHLSTLRSEKQEDHILHIVDQEISLTLSPTR
mmetsp:Transcript_108278/g.169337  ORF Transcript_108278/g.169337 Transcript_108278/m.169337 type:complete len:87 (+) Transcript_108278:942-1202(+)